MRAVFRCDAGPAIGAGHMVRCLALATALRERGWECQVFARPGSAGAVASIADGSTAIIEDEQADDPARLVKAFPEGCDLVVLDSYHLGRGFIAGLGDWAARRLVLQDSPAAPVQADWVLDPALGRTAADYAPWLEAPAQILAGPDYALMRPAIRAARRPSLQRRTATTRLHRVFVSLGGGDAGAHEAAVIDGIGRSGLDMDVDFVTRNAAGLPGRAGSAAIRGYGQTPDIHEFMAAADLAIGAAGGSAWERCCLGLPTLMTSIAANQGDNFGALRTAGAAQVLPTDSKRLAASVAELLRIYSEDLGALRDMGNNAARLCDGLGARRVAQAIDPRRASDGLPVTLRNAVDADAELMFAWQQMPEIRRFTPNPRPPGRDEHLAWFARRMSAPSVGLFCVIEHDGRPVGVLRLDPIEGERWGIELEPTALLVSILLHPGIHSTGIGYAALRAARDLEPSSAIYAEVLPGNHASDRLFRKAGYAELVPGLFYLN